MNSIQGRVEINYLTHSGSLVSDSLLEINHYRACTLCHHIAMTASISEV